MPYLALLLLPVLAVIAAPAHALTIYKCTGAEGVIAYQATPCGGQQRGSTFALRPELAAAAAPAAARPDREATRPSPRSRQPAAAAPRRRARTAIVSVTPDASWECRAANGDVFYQHSACPAAVAGSIELRHAATRGRSRSSAAAIAVSGKPIARGDACRRIHAASASDRPGHERDEDVSTYERNLGRDPCR
jgi:hypothetical protein